MFDNLDWRRSPVPTWAIHSIFSLLEVENIDDNNDNKFTRKKELYRTLYKAFLYCYAMEGLDRLYGIFLDLIVNKPRC